MKKIIGSVTTYHGSEHRYPDGYKVRVIAVMKNALQPGVDGDSPEYAHITDDETLEELGAVSEFDRVEVQPWLAKEGRFSFVTSDPRAVDLACFKRVRKAA